MFVKDLYSLVNRAAIINPHLLRFGGIPHTNSAFQAYYTTGPNAYTPSELGPVTGQLQVPFPQESTQTYPKYVLCWACIENRQWIPFTKVLGEISLFDLIKIEQEPLLNTTLCYLFSHS